MPLEALWWVDDPHQRDILPAVALGTADLSDAKPGAWRWRAMIVQPAPIGASTIARCIDGVRAKKEIASLARLRFGRWQEGRCAQVLHVGPYSEEGPAVARLHPATSAVPSSSAPSRPWR